MSNLSNLEKAKRALSGKRRFKVIIEESETYEIEVEAKSQQEANDLAMKEYEEGNIQSNGGNGGNIIETEELED
ncbi:MAG: hypothetical protein A2561_01295 [Candidatus Staskawiczbacteria bacterium RIFOXYD1_FULL_32_13]|uniref:Uncharacterized protein n=1 Tax=Candidatus Staskawiczbacteria bacterium RIFOXYD1_FULL_32_13 TaxID=1802234 RepID=A0A1G2JPY5_9BACT|nr:MAG: hypothetical protein A2256_00295 [Candidatus Staskawiczbacteria bacterium RIFOXYA2_FULL_32_7]OGZ89204.1 MAG: hypothetical protein A2561_01295 [Candidatus Staskawiczbacteria bacterium RIFOXYD1_FULL_32_13]